MRRFGRPGGGRSNASVTFTKSEPYALCYYLMTMFEDVSNSKILSSCTTATSLLISCAKILNKLERLEEVVGTEIKNLENKKLLVPLAEETDSCFYGTNYSFKYEQDKTLERRMRNYDFDGEEACNVDICRILSVSERPIFSSIINTAIFRDNDDFSLTDKISLSAKIKKAIFDISKVQFLVEQTKLSENEARFVLLMCRFETIPELREIVRDSDDRHLFYDNVPSMIDVSKKEYKYMLRDDQKIKTFGFVDKAGDYDSDLDECIESQSIEPYFADVLKPLDCADSYSLDSFAVKDELVDISLDLLKGKNPVSLLFYGKPGSGKTELAKSLCKQTGNQIFIFKNEKELNDKFSVLNRLVCLLSMEREDTVIIVDEADTL